MADEGSTAAASSDARGSQSSGRAPADRRLAALGTHLRAAGSSGGGELKSLTAAIADMKAEQQRMREERKRAAKELKNAQRRKRRLKGKARQLSNEDLLAVLLLRQESATAAGADADDAPAGSAPASAASGTGPEGEP